MPTFPHGIPQKLTNSQVVYLSSQNANQFNNKTISSTNDLPQYIYQPDWNAIGNELVALSEIISDASK